jgi:hypothetical protein
MTRRKPVVVEAEPARRVKPPAAPVAELPALDEAGEGSGMVEIKTRVPIHLHIALAAAAERNARSLAGELRYAAQQHVEREASRR